MASGPRSFVSRHVLLALLMVSALTVADCAVGERIPDVHSTSFADRAVNLPAELHGKAAGILVLGFSRGSRDAVASWATKIAADYRTSDVVAYYELPVVASVPGFVRGILLRSIKSSAPERAHKRIVPITTDEAGWRTVVHYSQPDDPYVLVVDGKGDVVWQTQGQATDAAYAALKQQVEALKARAAR
jgi:hypothetical protein